MSQAQSAADHRTGRIFSFRPRQGSLKIARGAAIVAIQNDCLMRFPSFRAQLCDPLRGRNVCWAWFRWSSARCAYDAPTTLCDPCGIGYVRQCPRYVARRAAARPKLQITKVPSHQAPNSGTTHTQCPSAVGVVNGARIPIAIVQIHEPSLGGTILLISPIPTASKFNRRYCWFYGESRSAVNIRCRIFTACITMAAKRRSRC